jgi:AcrR family transcriptional regulator
MARRKTTPRQPHRDDHALDSLEEIFLGEGVRRVSVGELARRLRCSRRTLYALAKSKQELFLLVVDRFLTRIRRLGDEAASARDDPAARIEAYLEPGIQQVARSTNLFFADIAALPPAKRMLEEHQRQRIEGLRRIVTAGMRRRMFRGLHPHLVADVLSLAYRRVSQPEFLATANLSMTEAYAEVGRLFLHGLLHPQAARATDRARRRDRGAFAHR